MIDRRHGRGWLLVGTLLGIGVLPCPECGAPMMFHFWPVAMLLAVVQVLKGRYRTRSAKGELPSEGNCLPCGLTDG